MRQKDQWHFYSPIGRFVRWWARLLTRKYRCSIQPPAEPVVYVCRHLDMHGPYTVIEWMPFDTHPMMLSVFTDFEEARRQYTQYTFSVRRGEEPREHDWRAEIAARLAVLASTTFQAIPVYRDARAVKTMRRAMEMLARGESLVIWPDKDYRAGYEKPCELYTGFLILGELYFRKYGKELKFVPLYVDDANGVLQQRDPITLTDYKTEHEDVARRLARAIDAPSLEGKE